MEAILTFHSVDDGNSVLSFPPDDLDALLQRLRHDDVALVSLKELIHEKGHGDRVALTFDDGMTSVVEKAAPILAAHAAPATVFVVSEYVGRNNSWPSQPDDAPAYSLMPWSDLRGLAAAGWEIGAHTATHPMLTNLSQEQLQSELTEAQSRLEDELQVSVSSFAYPYGAWDETIESHVGKIYSRAVTTRLGCLTGASRSTRLPRLDSYYLRGHWARRPLFSAGSRCRLKLRGLMRRVRRGGRD